MFVPSFQWLISTSSSWLSSSNESLVASSLCVQQRQFPRGYFSRSIVLVSNSFLGSCCFSSSTYNLCFANLAYKAVKLFHFCAVRFCYSFIILSLPLLTPHATRVAVHLTLFTALLHFEVNFEVNCIKICFASLTRMSIDHWH